MASKDDLKVMKGVIMNEMTHLFLNNATPREEDKENNRDLS